MYSCIIEYTGDYNELVYLRARMYAPGVGRFLTRDTWGGDYNRPLSLNRWKYVEGNPVNRTDPSGMTPLLPCPNQRNPTCLSKVMKLKTEAQRIHDDVKNGNLLPVEGFAQFLDSAMLKFNNDITSTMWAATLVINGFDSSFSPISSQALNQQTPGFSYHIGQDWLPYKDYSCNDIKDYYAPGVTWVCTERGDWKVEYWDKTANQAYHGWFFAAVSFFEGRSIGLLADLVHEGTQYDLPANGLPPVSGNTMEDHALSMKMIQLGYMLDPNAATKAFFFQDCPPDLKSIIFPKIQSISIGNWIRANLQDQTVK
jgi:RHS repeat-associated protein